MSEKMTDLQRVEDAARRLEESAWRGNKSHTGDELTIILRHLTAQQPIAQEAASGPVAWMAGDGRVINDEPKRSAINSAYDSFSIPLYAAPPAQQEGADAADMFWDDANPEQSESSINDVVGRAYENGSEPGEIIEIQQAIRLPNIKVKLVLSDDVYSYEYINCGKCNDTGMAERGNSGPFTRRVSISCDCLASPGAQGGG